MAEVDLTRACSQVGRFLYEFAIVEHEINESIVQILGLKGDAADVVAHSVDFFRKVNMLRTVAVELARGADKKMVGKVFNRIAELNLDRISMAHSPFEPAADEAVQFRRTVAKDGNVKKQDPLWSKQKFEDAYKQMGEVTANLKKLRPSLTISISEDGKTLLVSQYMYERP